MQNLLDEEELKQNENRKKELIDLIASKESLLFLGAGSSALVGYKVWTEIIKDLERLANECGSGFIIDKIKREGFPLSYVEDIKRHIENKTGCLNVYHALLYNEFSPKSPPSVIFHDTLINLPFKGIITTNYDTVLEAALSKKYPNFGHDNSLIIKEESAQRVSEFLLSFDHSRYQKRVAHLHGRFDEPASIILSHDDYVKKYGFEELNSGGPSKEANRPWSLHRKILWAILATRRVIFVGFSLNDPYFKFMLSLVSNDLWRWDHPIHYAIIGLSSEGDNAQLEKMRAKDLKRQFGIEVVFYEIIERSHRGLENMVNDINMGCKLHQRILNYPLKGDSTQLDSQSVDNREIAQTGSQGAFRNLHQSTWMESINRKMERNLNNED